MYILGIFSFASHQIRKLWEMPPKGDIPTVFYCCFCLFLIVTTAPPFLCHRNRKWEKLPQWGPRQKQQPDKYFNSSPPHNRNVFCLELSCCSYSNGLLHTSRIVFCLNICKSFWTLHAEKNTTHSWLKQLSEMINYKTKEKKGRGKNWTVTHSLWSNSLLKEKACFLWVVS